MDDKKIEHFLALSDQLKFSKTAELLNLTQPALSRSIQSFEDELGITLFDRTTNKIKLTPAGNYLKNELLVMRTYYKTVIGQAHAIQSGYSGQVRIGITKGQSLFGVRKIILEYQKRHPELTVLLRSEDIRVLRRMLDNNSIDFAVGLLGDFRYNSRFGYRSVKKLPLQIAVSRDNPIAKRIENTITLSELKDETFIFLSENESCSHRSLIQRCNELGFWPKTKEVPDLLSMILWVEANYGIGAFTEASIAKNNPSLRFFELSDFEPPELVFLWAKSEDEPVKSAFISYLQEALSK